MSMKLKVKYDDTDMLEVFPRNLTPEELAGIKKVLRQTVMAICKDFDDWMLRE